MEQIQPRQPMRDALIHRLTVGILLLCNSAYSVVGLLWLRDANFDFSKSAAHSGLILIITGIIGTLLLLDGVRVVVGGLFPKRADFGALAYRMGQPLERIFGFGMPMLRDGEVIVDRHEERSSGEARPQLSKPELLGFDPYNTVHMVALVFAVLVLGYVFVTFVLGGDIRPSTLEFVITAIIQFGILVGGALLGVGLFFRRNWSATLQRLGLDEPSWRDVGIGFATAFGCLIALFFMAMIWVSIVGIERYEAQNEASKALMESINTIWLVLLVSVTSSVGEEIAFRGALQPIFGLWVTAIYFVLIHSQYLLTPATLILFVPALAFGYLRRYYSLYAAIGAHFAFNFIQLILPYIANLLGGG